jgi:putative tryptophan/tyrosine transport system substrate-binding protein
MTRATTGMSRRQVVLGAGALGLGLLAGCGRAFSATPNPRVPRIGYLHGSVAPNSPNVAAFHQGLGEYGYVDGQNIIVEFRTAEGNRDRIPALVAELVALPVDILVTAGTPTPHARAATSVLPIVQAAGNDLVADGLAASLARPGGNVTGLHIAVRGGELHAKRLELLREAVAHTARIGVMWARSPLHGTPLTLPEAESAAARLGLELVLREVQDGSELPAAFEALKGENVHALLDIDTTLPLAHTARFVALAAQHWLPAMYISRQVVEAGGLMVYGPSLPSLHRRAAYYVDRILKGANPADLPIEQPREFDFIINLKTAQALGLTIPQHVLLQATEVIQ